MRRTDWMGGVILLLTTSAPAVGAEPEAFFEQKIRPILVEQCYSCHSTAAKKSKGGLFLDTKVALLKGGESGAVLVPVKPADSLLIKAVRYDHELKMPPKGKLSAAAIADLEKWVAMGAPDPRVSTGLVVNKTASDSDAQGRTRRSRLPVGPR